VPRLRHGAHRHIGWLVLPAALLIGCAIVPAPGGGHVLSAGHHVIINHTDEWTVTSITPMALDDSVTWAMQDGDLTLEMTKEAGEGQKVGLFTALVGMMGSFIGGLALAP